MDMFLDRSLFQAKLRGDFLVDKEGCQVQAFRLAGCELQGQRSLQKTTPKPPFPVVGVRIISWSVIVE
jgi:hypothetical protein